MEKRKAEGKRQKADKQLKVAKVAEVTETAGPREVRAVGRHLKISPTKVRGVLDLVRGETVEEAERILRFSSKKGAKVALKVLSSAIANAKVKGQFDEGSWIVADARADKGPVFRRKLDYKARGARGMIATPSTHLKIVISAQGGSASGGRQEPIASGQKNEKIVNEKMGKLPTESRSTGRKEVKDGS